jgi:chromate reductase
MNDQRPEVITMTSEIPPPDIAADAVLEASWESFPASDPPGWSARQDPMLATKSRTEESRMETTMRVLGIAGSLRSGSYNRAALRAAQQLAPRGVEIKIFELDGIPPYNQDEEAHPPGRVTELKAAARAADAILFVTPEYNYSIPGVLKNAIDWASRPYGDSAWEGKPVAVMGASISLLGTARAQYHLRQMFVFLDMHPVNRPEVMIANAAERFDQEGRLIDGMSRELIRQLLTNLQSWTYRLNPADRTEEGIRSLPRAA